MPNTTNIPAPRVPFIDQRTGLMSREWYRFFFNQFTLLTEASGTQHNSLGGLQGGTTGQYYHLTQDEYVGTGSGVFVRSDSPVFTGPISFSGPLTLTGTLSGANAVFTGSLGADSGTFTSAVSAGSGVFAGPISATTGTFTGGVTGTTLTLSGLATFNAGATGTDADFTTGTLGNFSFSADDITSSPLTGGSGQMNFYTLNLDIPATVLAMNIDNQQRLNFPAVSLIGGPPGLINPTNFYQEGRSFLDNISPPATTNTYAVSNVFSPANIAADNTGITYTYGITVYIGGPLQEGTNVTIDEELALVVNSGNSVFSSTLFVGSGSGSVATSDAQGVFCSQGVLGYGPDPFAFSPGGAVTQLTSKSQGVTLNKGCGAITMNAAALAAGASVEFVLTNSFIAAFDTVICNMGPGGTASTYLVQCQAVAAGSCRFRVTNYSGTSRSEACVVNFAIIKAVNA
jgi:hypothetical protein